MIALDYVGDHVVGEALAVHALNTACKRASMFRHHRHRIQSRCLGKLNSNTNQGFGARGIYLVPILAPARMAPSLFAAVMTVGRTWTHSAGS